MALQQPHYRTLLDTDRRAAQYKPRPMWRYLAIFAAIALTVFVFIYAKGN